jgi:4-diphosphocytidyl-2-C-methyl-D-erythritol kinase
MKSFAKINIGLNILDKRPDGYHNIETVFAPINIYDEIEFSECDEILIETNIEWLPTDEKNICFKAAKTLRDIYAPGKGVRIKLTKKIPVGAGLGGGSSDGATVLKELNSLWNLNLSHSELCSIALSLGSDVPYFLKNGVAYAKGRGELLTYLDLNLSYYIVIVYPNLSVSTKWAYEKYIEKENIVESGYDKLFSAALKDTKLFRDKFKNDFEEIVFKRYAGLISIKNVLYEKGAVYASLSGSGSSLFGLYAEEKDARRAYEAFISRFKTFFSNSDFFNKNIE